MPTESEYVQRVMRDEATRMGEIRSERRWRVVRFAIIAFGAALFLSGLARVTLAAQPVPLLPDPHCPLWYAELAERRQAVDALAVELGRRHTAEEQHALVDEAAVHVSIHNVIAELFNRKCVR